MPPRDTAEGIALRAGKAAFPCAPRGSLEVSVPHAPRPGSSAQVSALAEQDRLCRIQGIPVGGMQTSSFYQT